MIAPEPRRNERSVLSYRRLADPSDVGSEVLRPAPEANLGFREYEAILIEKPLGEGWSFRIDDEPLAQAPDRPGTWIWKPGFFAGEVTAELIDANNGRSTTFLLDVAPNPTKLGRDVFRDMMEQLRDYDPTLLVGSEPATATLGELGTTQDPLVEFARLRRYAPALLAALGDISRRPRWTLRSRRELLSLDRVRRCDRYTATSAARLRGWSPDVSGRDVSDPYAQVRLNVPVVEETLDSAANRCIVAVTRAMLRRTAALRGAIDDLVSREQASDTRSALASRWPVRRSFLTEFKDRLFALLRSSPFSEVTRAEISAAGLNAISSDPLYARAYSLAWRALRSGVEGAVDDERLWISPTWEIYERWCFVRLGQMLERAFPDLSWRKLAKPPAAATASIRGDGPNLVLELLLQPHCPGRAVGRPDQLWSISLARIPDLVLKADGRSGAKFIVLDAKYRHSRQAILDAMGSAHIYHDSLRCGERPPDVSLLLVPASTSVQWLEECAYQREHRVGVQVLSMEEPRELPELLRDLLVS